MKVVYNTKGFGLRLTETEMKMFCALLGYKLNTHPPEGIASDTTWFAGVDWKEFRKEPLLVRLVEEGMLSNKDLAVVDVDDEWYLDTDYRTYEQVIVQDCPTCWGCGDSLEFYYYEDFYCGYCQPEQLETEGESK
jgi:hypothetical protein